MKVLFLTRFDFTHSRKDGGLEISYRNYSLIESIYGKENVKLYIISSQNQGKKDNIEYFYIKDDMFHNYLSYFSLKDRIPLKVEKHIIHCINEYNPDFIFWDGSTFGQIAGKLHRKIKSVVYFHNVERQYTWDQVKQHSPLCIFRYMATVYNEKKIINYTDNYICMNNRDAGLLNNLYGVKSHFIFPATFSDSYNEKISVNNIKNNKFQLLFIGSFFAHNYKGLIWYIDNVLPEIDCELVIVGKNMEKLANYVDSEKVNIVGTVDSLDEYYRGADAIVMPIFMGGGMKVKTAEALMYGKTIFASTEALQGYDVDGQANIFRCDTKEEYINDINEYMKSSNKTKFNSKIRNLFLEKYCTDSYKSQFREYLNEVVLG
jgi:hypothetical protein